MKLLPFLFLLLCINSFSQNLKELETVVELDFNFGTEVQNYWKKRDQLFKDLESEKKDWDNLSEKESKLIEKYNETYNSMWDVEGGGCSWYCGAGAYSVNSSSYLKSQKVNTYRVSNIKDFSYQTSWVEGVDGYGIGEYIEFVFDPEHPRITVIKIANGYIKSKKVWKNNSRVKKFKMYLNNKVYAIINLKDIYSLQAIILEKPLGYSDRGDYEKLKELSKWKIKFEIMEVYKGDKYSDTAITELFFDGIDVH